MTNPLQTALIPIAEKAGVEKVPKTKAIKVDGEWQYEEIMVFDDLPGIGGTLTDTGFITVLGWLAPLWRITIDTNDKGSKFGIILDHWITDETVYEGKLYKTLNEALAKAVKALLRKNKDELL